MCEATREKKTRAGHEGHIYIYILDPHMAPYGACKSYKAEFEVKQANAKHGGQALRKLRFIQEYPSTGY